MNIPFSPPKISENAIESVVKTLKSGWITTGPKVKKFENQIRDYIKADGTICTNSATASLEMCLRVLGIGPGDEVITSAYTYTASASVIEHVGAKIVLIDTQKDSLEMDYNQLAQKISEKTKAIIPVDIAGVICDYNAVYKIVEENKDKFNTANDLHKKIGRIAVIADAAHSFGAIKNNKLSGTFADFTCFSFHAVKNLTTSEGGAIVWHNLDIESDYLYETFKMWILHGQNKDAFTKMQKGNWEYDIKFLGYKANMTDISAAIGIEQLKEYPSNLRNRKKIVNYYNEHLNEKVLYLKHLDKDFESSCHLYITWIKDITEQQRNEIIAKMAKKGIATNVHYKPLPMFTSYKSLGFEINEFPNSFNHYKNEITLPLYPQLTSEEVKHIIDSFNEIVLEVKI